MAALSVLLRVSWRLAWRSGHSTRWRRLVVPVCAALTVAIVLAGVGVLNLAVRYVDRENTARSAVPTDPSDRKARFASVQSSDFLGEQEIALTWIEPTSNGTLHDVPGLSSGLRPGEAAVSPALNRMLEARPADAQHFPQRVVLGREVLRGPDELVAFVRPSRPGSVLNDSRAVFFSGPASPGAGISLFPNSRTNFRLGVDLIAALVLFIAVPCAVLLWLASTAGSLRRQRRIATLAWLGASPSTAAFVTAAETLALALPGLVVGTAVLSVWAPTLTSIPVVDQPVFAGDLALPWVMAASVIGVVALVLVAVSALIGARAAHQPQTGPRPRHAEAWRTPAHKWLRVAVLAISGLCLFASLTLSVASDLATPLFVIAGVVLVLGVPSLCSAAVAAVGARLVDTSGTWTLLQGRQLARVGGRDLRPFAAAGVVLATIVALTGLYSRVDNPIVGASDAPQAALLRWSSPQPGDLPAIDRRLDRVKIYPVLQEGGRTRIVGACATIARSLPAVRCQPDATNRADAVAALLGVAPNSVTFEPTARPDTPAAALLVSDKPDRALADRIYTAALSARVPRPLVDVSSWQPSSPDLFLRWLILAALSSGASILLALLFAQAEVVAANAQESRVLLRLGTASSRLRRMIAVRHMLVAASCNIVGFGAGLVVAIAFTKGSDHDFPTPGAGLLASFAIAAGAVLVGGVFAWLAVGAQTRVSAVPAKQ